MFKLFWVTGVYNITYGHYGGRRHAGEEGGGDGIRVGYDASGEVLLTLCGCKFRFLMCMLASIDNDLPFPLAMSLFSPGSLMIFTGASKA